MIAVKKFIAGKKLKLFCFKPLDMPYIILISENIIFKTFFIDSSEPFITLSGPT